MAIFNKGNVSTGSSETTVISTGARMEGQFYFNSMLHLDGEINGVVHSQSSVVIGKNGSLKGQLSADKVVVGGFFEGNIDSEYLEILNGGFVNGDVSTRHIAIETGGRINGKIDTKDNINLLENNIQD